MTNELIEAGPVLLLRGAQGARWRLSAMFVIRGEREPDDLKVAGVSLDVPPRHVAGWRDFHVWRFDFAVAPGTGETRVPYGFTNDPNRWAFTLPSDGDPQRVAFLSGIGVATADTANAIWRGVIQRHAERPFHILLFGGGQIDGAAVWRERPNLAAWWREHGAGVSVAEADRLTQDMAEEAMDHQLDRAMALWRHPVAGRLFASTPSVMMWDDHETFAGWSALSPARRATRPVRGVAAIARRWFGLFQLGATDDDLPECVWGGGPDGLTQGVKVGSLGILALDLVSERDAVHMLSTETWEQLPEWLAHFGDCRDLLIMSSRPLALLAPTKPRWLPIPAKLDDGAGGVDHWRAPKRDAEWTRMSRLLLGLREHTGCRVTILSGMEGAPAPLAPPAAHPAGFQSWLEGPGGVIRQLVSSCVDPAKPSPLAAALAERRAGTPDTPKPDWRLSFSPSTGDGGVFLRHANWLSLHRHDAGNADALWYAANPALVD